MANEIQTKREKVKHIPLDGKHSVHEEASQNDLRSSQIHRLNQSRLDHTLSMVSEHTSWSYGLGLADHVSALRSKFVQSFGDSDMNAYLSAYFGYDSQVFANVENPSFSRSCKWAHSGICEQGPFFALAIRLASELDQMLQDTHLLGSGPKLVFFRNNDVSQICSSSWMLGCAYRKPISHVGIAMHTVSCGKFGITMVDGIPRIATMHQAFRDMMGTITEHGGDVNTVSLEACVSKAKTFFFERWIFIFMNWIPEV